MTILILVSFACGIVVGIVGTLVVLVAYAFWDQMVGTWRGRK